MSKYFVLMIFIFILSGCSSKHFVASDFDSITFSLRLPDANRVQFAASFDHYNLRDAQRNSSGIWQVKIPIRSELKYFYVVDGLMYIPECRFKEKDDFGAENCFYFL